MNIEDLTLKQIHELQSLLATTPTGGVDNSAWVIGANYLIRTVTMTDTGRLVAITSQELVLEDAAWIADSGRFSDAIKAVKFNEVEPFPEGKVIVGRGGVIDAVQIKELPRSLK